MCRDEALRKTDDAGTIAAGLADQAAGLLCRSFAVKEDRSGLYGCNLHHPVAVAHD
jgi:hypothetical protein